MAEDFKAAAPQLAVYGKEAGRVFEGLAKQAKATGVAMSSLLAITAQFDTYEGAAQAAGKLNAVLGTQINSIDLLLATDEERIAMLKEAAASTGMAWSEMGKFQQMAIANAAGITDMAEAAKLFGNEQENMTEEEKKLADAIKEGQTVMKKFEIIVTQIAIKMTPLLEKISAVLDTVITWMDENQKLVQTISSFIAILGTAILVIGAVKLAMLAWGATMLVLKVATLGFGAALWTAFGPILLPIAAVAAAIYGLYKLFIDTSNEINDTTLSPKFAGISIPSPGEIQGAQTATGEARSVIAPGLVRVHQGEEINRPAKITQPQTPLRTSAATGGGATGQPVILQLNDREIGRMVLNVLEKKMNLRTA